MPKFRRTKQFRRTKKKLKQINENRIKKDLYPDVTEEERVACDYAIACNMAKRENRKKFGVKDWWIKAESDYNKTFKTNYTKLTTLVKEEI